MVYAGRMVFTTLRFIFIPAFAESFAFFASWRFVRRLEPTGILNFTHGAYCATSRAFAYLKKEVCINLWDR